MPCHKDDSRVDSTGRAYAGSQRQIQTYVNESCGELNQAIELSIQARQGILSLLPRWVSPLAAHNYDEYRDEEFLSVIGLSQYASALNEFWPRRGPCWDALACFEGTTAAGLLTVEAKSHISEMRGSWRAHSETSQAQIRRAFDSTKDWLGVPRTADWTAGNLYQSANRYAHLYFFRQVVGIEAWLVNTFFLNDPHSRTSIEQWQAAIRQAKQELCLPADGVPYTVDIFLDALTK